MPGDGSSVVFVLAGKTDLRVIKDGNAWKLDDRVVHDAIIAGSRSWRVVEDFVPLVDDPDVTLAEDSYKARQRAIAREDVLAMGSELRPIGKSINRPPLP